ncbi:hypothetical protein YC2023_050305 [Brassica napus]
MNPAHSKASLFQKKNIEKYLDCKFLWILPQNSYSNSDAHLSKSLNTIPTNSCSKKIKYETKQSPTQRIANQAPAQKTKKMGQRKSNHRKNKVTTKQKDVCLKHWKRNHQLRDKKHLAN